MSGNSRNSSTVGRLQSNEASPMTDQTTSLSAALTCNGLEIWGIHTYMVTPTLDDVLKHEDASGQSSFQGNAQELLEALGNIKSDDPGTRSALRESIAYGNQILSKQRFVDQVISAYHNGDEPAGKWTSQHDEILGITSAAILKAALASKTVTTTFNHSNLKRLVNVALSFDRPASLDASDWLELATRCLGKI